MRFDIITILPDLFKGPFEHKIYQRAIDAKQLEINIIDLRPFGLGNSKQVDDYQYGGGAGMVLMPEPLSKCINHCCSTCEYDEIIFLTPDGETLNQSIANHLAIKKNLLLICGHYKGIDQRIRDKYVTREISIGDYVLSGGEIATMVLVDAVARLIPGILNNETSALTDSFQDNLLAPPVYTRPENFEEMQVPEVLLQGNHKKIEAWRNDMAEKRTKTRRPDLKP